jgi:hydroxyacylglutathione hydrolase
MPLNITTFPVGLYQCNCSIVSCTQTNEAIIIDPGSDADKIIGVVQKQGLKVKYLLHTHAHLDHFGATASVKQHCCDAEAVLHKDDLLLYEAHTQQSMFLQLPDTEIVPIDHYLEDEEDFLFGSSGVKALFTPGHSPGSSCFSLETSEEQVLFAGDTLFRDGVGRTDLPGGDQSTLVKSIKDRLYKLDEGCRVIPGHGLETSIFHEKNNNPYVQA